MPTSPTDTAPLSGPALVASALVGGACLAGIGNAVALWHDFGVVRDYVAGVPGARVAYLASAEATTRTVGIVCLLALLSAGVASQVWRARVRRVADAGTTGQFAWLVGLWFAVTAISAVVTLVSGDATVYGTQELARVASWAAVVQCGCAVALVVMIYRVTRRHPDAWLVPAAGSPGAGRPRPTSG